MTDEDLEKRIDAAIRAAVKAGLRLKDGVTLETHNCCPLGAVAFVADGAAAKNYAMEIAGRELGREWIWCNSFAIGFDDKHRGSWSYEPYAMGARFRARWQAGEYEAGAE